MLAALVDYTIYMM